LSLATGLYALTSTCARYVYILRLAIGVRSRRQTRRSCSEWSPQISGCCYVWGGRSAARLSSWHDFREKRFHLLSAF